MRRQKEFSWLQFFVSGIVAAIGAVAFAALILYFGHLATPENELSDYLRATISWSLIVAAPFGGAFGFFRYAIEYALQQSRQKSTIIAVVTSAIWGAGFAVAWIIAFNKGLYLYKPVVWGVMCVVVGYFSARSAKNQES